MGVLRAKTCQWNPLSEELGVNSMARRVLSPLSALKRFRSEADMQGQKHPKGDTIELGGGYTPKHTYDDSRLPDQEPSMGR